MACMIDRDGVVVVRAAEWRAFLFCFWYLIQFLSHSRRLAGVFYAKVSDSAVTTLAKKLNTKLKHR